MVRLTAVVCRYLPEWYHLQKSGSGYFKKQAFFHMTRYYRNLGWSSFKNARNRYQYYLNGEMYNRALESQRRRDINRARIAAACEEHGYNYQNLMSTLPKIDINLNLASLAHLAIYEPKSFKAVVDISRGYTIDELQPANFSQNHI